MQKPISKLTLYFVFSLKSFHQQKQIYNIIEIIHSFLQSYQEVTLLEISLWNKNLSLTKNIPLSIAVLKTQLTLFHISLCKISFINTLKFLSILNLCQTQKGILKSQHNLEISPFQKFLARMDGTMEYLKHEKYYVNFIRREKV